MACCHVFRPFLCCWMRRSIAPSQDLGRCGRPGEGSMICFFSAKRYWRVEGIRMNQWIRKTKPRNYFQFCIIVFFRSQWRTNGDVCTADSDFRTADSDFHHPPLAPSSRSRMLSIWSWWCAGLSSPLSIASGFSAFPIRVGPSTQ